MEFAAAKEEVANTIAIITTKARGSLLLEVTNTGLLYLFLLVRFIRSNI
jgi:hypothetical protein